MPACSILLALGQTFERRVGDDSGRGLSRLLWPLLVCDPLCGKEHNGAGYAFTLVRMQLLARVPLRST